MLEIMDQPRAHAAPGGDPIRTIGTAELKAMLERGDDFKPIMALGRGHSTPGTSRARSISTPRTSCHAALRPDDDVVFLPSERADEEPR
jgi:hypothetical protein